MQNEHSLSKSNALTNGGPASPDRRHLYVRGTVCRDSMFGTANVRKPAPLTRAESRRCARPPGIWDVEVGNAGEGYRSFCFAKRAVA